ncbi:addiction module protein [Salinimicrobium sp. CAU 1759]
MNSTELKNKVQEYVDTADVKLLRMIKALVETYQSEEQEFSLSEEQYQMIDKRREAHSNGFSKSLSWEEVKEKARKKG